jgi:hypothetical protein
MERPAQKWLILTRTAIPTFWRPSHFADVERHPERDIAFLENTGRYEFRPYAFTIASGSQWNLTATGDLNDDGWLDVIIGAMDLEDIADFQRRSVQRKSATQKSPIPFFENRMRAKSNAGSP